MVLNKARISLQIGPLSKVSIGGRTQPSIIWCGWDRLENIKNPFPRHTAKPEAPFLHPNIGGSGSADTKCPHLQ